MFRAAIRGERRGGATLGTSRAAVWDVGTFGEGVGGDRSIGVITLGGGLRASLGGESVLQKGRDLVGNVTLNFSGARLSAGVGG